MGIGLGLVLGSYENIAPPVPLPGERELPKVPMGEQVSSFVKIESSPGHLMRRSIR